MENIAYRKMTELPQTTTSDKIMLIANENGEQKQVPAEEIADRFSGSWNDLTDRPFSSETTSEIITIYDGLVEVAEDNQAVILDGAGNITYGVDYHLSIDNGSDINYTDLVAKGSLIIESMTGYVYFYDTANNVVAYFASTSGTLSVERLPAGNYSIHLFAVSVEETVDKLDEKYLPDSVVTITPDELSNRSGDVLSYDGYKWRTRPIATDYCMVTHKDGFISFCPVYESKFNGLVEDYSSIGRASIVSIVFARSITTIGRYAFRYAANIVIEKLPPNLRVIEYGAFDGCQGLSEITFVGKAETIDSGAFVGCSNLTTINVPWAEGEVANAPWGAVNATINYNYTDPTIE